MLHHLARAAGERGGEDDSAADIARRFPDAQDFGHGRVSMRSEVVVVATVKKKPVGHNLWLLVDDILLE